MRHLTTLEFGGSTWGVDYSSLREVIEQLPMTPVPMSPAVVRGVMNLRGELIPVLALDHWLGLPTPDGSIIRRPWMAVIDSAPYYFGILTERVGTVMFDGDLEPAAQGQAQRVEGTAQTPTGAISILRLPALIRHIEQGIKLDRYFQTAA